MALDYSAFSYDPSSRTYVNAASGQRLNESEYSRQAQEASANAAAESNHVRMSAQGLNDDGSPIRQAYDSLVDPATGKLKSGYELQTNALDPSKWDGYSKYKQEALRSGPSAWAQLQTQTNNAAAMNNKESAARQAASGMTMGNSAMAMKGGLSQGSRALAARGSARDLMMSRQQASRAGDTANMQTATTDEGNRINQLAALSTSEQNIGQFNTTLDAKTKEYNIGNMVNDHTGKNAYADMTYQEQMKKWAANRQADATQNSGGGK